MCLTPVMTQAELLCKQAPPRKAWERWYRCCMSVTQEMSLPITPPKICTPMLVLELYLGSTVPLDATVNEPQAPELYLKPAPGSTHPMSKVYHPTPAASGGANHIWERRCTSRSGPWMPPGTCHQIQVITHSTLAGTTRAACLFPPGIFPFPATPLPRQLAGSQLECKSLLWMKDIWTRRVGCGDRSRTP